MDIVITPGKMVKFGSKTGLLMTITDGKAKVVIFEENDDEFDQQNIDCSTLKLTGEKVPERLQDYCHFLWPSVMKEIN